MAKFTVSQLDQKPASYTILDTDLILMTTGTNTPFLSSMKVSALQLQTYFSANTATSKWGESGNFTYLIDTTQSVGIGITTPDTPLHIKTAAEDNILTLEAGGDNDAFLYCTSNTVHKGVIGYNAANDALQLAHSESQVGVADAQVVVKEGNVGIGTAAPSVMLHVSGGTSVTGGGTNSPAGVPGLHFIYDPAGGISYIKSDHSGSTNKALQFEGSIYSFNGNGNVGIGTTAPYENLHIAQSDSSENFIQFTNSTTAHTSDRGAHFGITSAEQAAIWQFESGDIVFGVGNDQKMCIQTSGNVGIGTDVPTALLHLSAAGGDGALMLTPGSTTGEITTNASLFVGIDQDNNSTTESFTIFKDGNSNHRVLSVQESGNATLSGSGNTVLTIASPDGQQRTLQFNDNSAMGAQINCDSSENLEFKAGGSATNKMIILGSNGHVGIGTSSCPFTLMINGSLGLMEKGADPAETTEGQCVIWMSDGTGKGDDGDVMIATSAGGTTRYGTLFDYSAGSTW